MAVKLQVKRGSKADLPVLNEGEFGFCLDSKELYIGTTEGVNKLLNESSVFVAAYGSTTNAELWTAYQAGKAVFCHDETAGCLLGAVIVTETDAVFGIFDGDTLTTRVCSGGTWSTNTVIPETQSNKTTDLFEDSGESKYPSASAVVDYVARAAGGNPNLLDNWYFLDPINQRGQTEYANGYAVDRWYNVNAYSKSAVSDEGYTLTADGGAAYFLQALGETERLSDFVGKTVTLSVLLADGTLAYGSGVFPESGYLSPFSISNGCNFRVGAGYEKPMVNISVPSGASVTMQAIKLEFGSIQTLAHQDDDGNWVLNEIPNKAQELAKCQRYQAVNLIGPMMCVLTSGVGFFVPLPVSMRATPALFGSYKIYSVAGVAQDGFTFNKATLIDNGVYLYFTKASHGLTGGYIQFDATSGLDANL